MSVSFYSVVDVNSQHFLEPDTVDPNGVKSYLIAQSSMKQSLLSKTNPPILMGCTLGFWDQSLADFFPIQNIVKAVAQDTTSQCNDRFGSRHTPMQSGTDRILAASFDTEAL